MRDFRSLDVWHRAVQLVVGVYRETARFPASEQYGLTSQLRRASVSIPSNIAEGVGRKSQRDLCRFLAYARGSAAEVESQLFIAHRLSMLALDGLRPLLTESREIQRMLSSLMETIEAGEGLGLAL